MLILFVDMSIGNVNYGKCHFSIIIRNVLINWTDSKITYHSCLYREDPILTVRLFNINTHACAMWGHHLSFMDH